jgi:hypothetical protein
MNRAPIRGIKASNSEVTPGDLCELAVINRIAARILPLLSEVKTYADL